MIGDAQGMRWRRRQWGAQFGEIARIGSESRGARLPHRIAREQVRIKESQLSGTPDGTMDRVAPSIKKTFDMPIPEDL